MLKAEFLLNIVANLRALIFHPQIHADKRIRANYIGARVVGGAVSLQVPRHRRLAPLCPIERGWQRQMLALQANIVHAAFGVIRVDLERPHAGVLGLSSGVDAFLLVNSHHLMPREYEGVVITSALATVHGQNGGRPVPIIKKMIMIQDKILLILFIQVSFCNNLTKNILRSFKRYTVFLTSSLSQYATVRHQHKLRRAKFLSLLSGGS